MTTHTVPGAHPGADLLTASRVFTRRSLRHGLRDVEALLMAILLPVMLMALFTYVFGGAMSVEGGGGRDAYLAYVVPGIAVTCAGFGAASTAVSVNHDLTGGLVPRLRAMPVEPGALLVGHAAASVVRNVLATAVVLLAAVLMGFRPEASLLGWLGILFVITLWIVAITAIFAGVGLLAGSPEAANGYGFVILFLPYLSSAFAPVESMPEWLQPVAGHQPVTPVVDSLRELFLGSAPGVDLVAAIGWSAGLTVVAVALVAAVLPRRLRSA